MKRATIDFGIDLGTTNSVIAVVHGNGAKEFVDTQDGSVLLPSAVWMDKVGTHWVGTKAKEHLLEDPDNAFSEFKQKMGSDEKVTFRRSGQEMLPEELSAELLKVLKHRAQEKTDETLDSVVVTVPAGFKMSANEATKRAALLAGFKTVFLLTEPVAAAFAYGFQSSTQKKYWLIYDFGGGTFDAAIVSVRDGLIQVVEHAGDNRLGGKNLDWDIVEKILLPKLNIQLNGQLLTMSSKEIEARRAIQKLKRAAEDAKIQVSRNGKVFQNYIEFIWNGNEITFNYSLSPNELESLAMPWVRQSIAHCLAALKAKGMTGNDIDKVILVGGSSLLPIVRELVSKEINSRIDFSIDPMSVVALGAAIFAGQQVNSHDNSGIEAANGNFIVEVEYNPVGQDISALVGGRFVHPNGSSFEGYFVEFREPSTLWRSPKISLTTNGVFTAQLHGESGRRCEFEIVLWDPEGRVRECSPKTLPYTVGNAAGRATLAFWVGIEKKGNVSKVFFEKNDSLPAKKTLDVSNAVALKKGDGATGINIPIWEGLHPEKPDLNKEIARFILTGAHPRIRRDIPAGTKMELTLERLADSSIKAKLYIELLDEVFDEKELLDSFEKNISSEELLRQLAEVENELLRIQRSASALSDSAPVAILHEIEETGLIEQAKHDVHAAQLDKSMTSQGHDRLLNLRAALDRAEDTVQWPSLVKEARAVFNDASEVVESHGTESERSTLQDLRSNLNNAITDKDPHGLRRSMEWMDSLKFQVLQEQPEFWVGLYQYVEELQSEMTDKKLAQQLLSQGRKAIENKDVASLKAAVRQMFGLLPVKNQEEASSRGFGSTIL